MCVCRAAFHINFDSEYPANQEHRDIYISLGYGHLGVMLPFSSVEGVGFYFGWLNFNWRTYLSVYQSEILVFSLTISVIE